MPGGAFMASRRGPGTCGRQKPAGLRAVTTSEGVIHLAGANSIH